MDGETKKCLILWRRVTTLNKDDATMKQVVKRKRNRPDLQQFGYELAEPGDNSKATMFIQALNKFDRVDLSDEKAVKQRMDDFWQLCIDFDTKPQVSGMADVLGLDRRRLWEITHDVPHRNLECSSATRDVIKKEYRKLEVLWEYYILNGKVNPVSAIFLGKNNFDYADRQEITLTPGTPLGDSPDQKQLEERIAGSVVVEE